MKKRLYDYIRYIENQSGKDLNSEEKQALYKNLITQINFFEHERLIHLIVTMSVAFFIVIFTLGFFIKTSLLLLIIDILLLALFIPYIIHYCRLENGVQKLYTYFDKLFDVDFYYHNV